MIDNLAQLRTEIGLLEAKIKSIEEQLKETTSTHIISELQITQSRMLSFLDMHKKGLAESIEGTDAPRMVYPSVFGSEISQGLTDYELVAGKDTLARVFIGHRPVFELPAIQPANKLTGGKIIIYKDEEPKAIHFDFPPFDPPIFGGSKLDFATLRIRGPRGIDIEMPGALGDGKFNNYSKSYSENDNVNFFINGSQIPVSGSYNFDARFYRNGLLVGTHALGRHKFHKTKDLRILIVVDTWPMPVEAWNSLFNALRYVHRNFPVRAGIGPIDGDPKSGLRYYIDPRPMDVDFPGWGPVRERLDAFNAEQAGNGKPDRAEHILTVRVQQDFESPLGGVGESGPGGRVAGVTLNVNPPADNVFATLICQEIGHNFLGSIHTPDPDIDDDAAFNLLDRKAISNPRSIMFGFYTGNKNTDSLFLPADWKKIRTGLMNKNSTGTA